MHRIIVQASFENASQRDVALTVIRRHLQAWKLTVEEAHETNQVTIHEDGMSTQSSH